MNPSSDSLFHFTKKENTFKRILENGLRYSFSFESFPDSVVNNIFCKGLFSSNIEDNNNITDRGIAIPMISFCDIPLTRVNTHSKRYGKYAFGISKDFLCKFYGDVINPVLYADSDSVITAIQYISRAQGIALRSFCSQIVNSKDAKVVKAYSQIQQNPSRIHEIIDTLPSELQEIWQYVYDVDNSINTIISLLKPTHGINVDGDKQCFYDEHEWRAIYPNVPDSAFEWQVGCSRKNYKNGRNTLNKSLNSEEGAYITIPGHWFNMISHIILPSEKDIPKISDYILSCKKLFGYNDIESSQRQHLLSKITSFERIEKDY